MKNATKTAKQTDSLVESERRRRAHVGMLCSRMAETSHSEGISPQMRWHWRKGYALPTLDRFLALCAACGIHDLTSFLDGYGEVRAAEKKD